MTSAHLAIAATEGWTKTHEKCPCSTERTIWCGLCEAIHFGTPPFIGCHAKAHPDCDGSSMVLAEGVERIWRCMTEERLYVKRYQACAAHAGEWVYVIPEVST